MLRCRWLTIQRVNLFSSKAMVAISYTSLWSLPADCVCTVQCWAYLVVGSQCQETERWTDEFCMGHTTGTVMKKENITTAGTSASAISSVLMISCPSFMNSPWLGQRTSAQLRPSVLEAEQSSPWGSAPDSSGPHWPCALHCLYAHPCCCCTAHPVAQQRQNSAPSGSAASAMLSADKTLHTCITVAKQFHPGTRPQTLIYPIPLPWMTALWSPCSILCGKKQRNEECRNSFCMNYWNGNLHSSILLIFTAKAKWNRLIKSYHLIGS